MTQAKAWIWEVLPVEEGWFQPGTVYSMDNAGGSPCWFYDGDYKITLETGPETPEMCDQRCWSQLVLCVLPKGHECKHFPMPLQMWEMDPIVPPSRVRIERVCPSP